MTKNSLRISGETTDYDKFTFSKMNRPVLDSHVTTLIQYIQKDGNNSSITCRPEIIDGKEYYQIIDGQHRFVACKMLEIPIQYDLWLNMKVNAMASLNGNQRKWSLENYLHFGIHYNQENQENDYIKLFKYFQETGIGISSLINIFDFSDSYARNFLRLRTARFKAGIWNMTTQKEAEEILSILKEISDTYNIKNIYHSKLVAAIPRMFFHPAFNKERLIKQIKLCPNALIVGYGSESDFLYELERIYNYGITDPSEKVIFLKRALSGLNARQATKSMGIE